MLYSIYYILLIHTFPASIHLMDYIPYSYIYQTEKSLKTVLYRTPFKIKNIALSKYYFEGAMFSYKLIFISLSKNSKGI